MLSENYSKDSGSPHYNGGMGAKQLTDEELDAALRDLPGWKKQEGKLQRDYKFADFAHAFGFMATSAIFIQEMDHHPEWSNVYNRVNVALTTHDARGITAKDVQLAKTLDAVAKKLL